MATLVQHLVAGAERAAERVPGDPGGVPGVTGRLGDRSGGGGGRAGGGGEPARGSTGRPTSSSPTSRGGEPGGG